jgi:hypothetical protein
MTKRLTKRQRRALELRDFRNPRCGEGRWRQVLEKHPELIKRLTSRIAAGKPLVVRGLLLFGTGERLAAYTNPLGEIAKVFGLVRKWAESDADFRARAFAAVSHYAVAKNAGLVRTDVP